MENEDRILLPVLVMMVVVVVDTAAGAGRITPARNHFQENCCKKQIRIDADCDRFIQRTISNIKRALLVNHRLSVQLFLCDVRY